MRDLPPYRPRERAAGYAAPSLRLDSNENPLGPAPAALRAIRACRDIHRYPDPSRLEAEIARACGVPEACVLALPGADAGIALVATATLAPGRDALTGFGAFFRFALAARATGATVRFADAPDHRFDVERIAACATPDTALVYLANPNNPTGTALSRAEIERLLTRLPAGAGVLLDSVYADFVPGPGEPAAEVGLDYTDGVDLLARHPDREIVVLRSFGKIAGVAGLRLGYAIGSPRMISALRALRGPYDLATPAIVAGLALLADPSHLERTKRLVAAERPKLTRMLESLGIRVVPGHGNFLYVEFPCAAAWIAGELARKGIAIRPLVDWGYPASAARITIGRPSDRRALLEALGRILAERV